jgi:pyruvate kinase
MIKTISEGQIEGIVIIIDSIKDIHGKAISNKVVITKELDQKLLSHLFTVKGIIVEEGSLLSHVSIFCREANIPCKLIDNATKIYKDGDTIKID